MISLSYSISKRWVTWTNRKKRSFKIWGKWVSLQNLKLKYNTIWSLKDPLYSIDLKITINQCKQDILMVTTLKIIQWINLLWMPLLIKPMILTIRMIMSNKRNAQMPKLWNRLHTIIDLLIAIKVIVNNLKSNSIMISGHSGSRSFRYRLICS